MSNKPKKEIRKSCYYCKYGEQEQNYFPCSKCYNFNYFEKVKYKR